MTLDKERCSGMSVQRYNGLLRNEIWETTELLLGGFFYWWCGLLSLLGEPKINPLIFKIYDKAQISTE